MGIANYIREIGRGKEGARSLSRAQAHDLMCQLLDGRLVDLEIGAFALAMRIKGESADELIGFLDAVHAHCLTITAPRRAVLLPSYNGSRKLPLLTPLLAQLLAAEGVPVLVHGPLHDTGRVTSAEVFAALGWAVVRSGDALHAAWQRGEPAFMPIDALCPPLAKLLDVRRVVGLRNSGHTVAKLLAPVSAALRAMNHTHPEYGVLLRRFIELTAADAVLLRGTEGEPVADARRAPKLDVFIGGVERAELSSAAHEGALAALPTLPRERDAESTALYIRAVLDGEQPVPQPLRLQVDVMLHALAAASSNASHDTPRRASG